MISDRFIRDNFEEIEDYDERQSSAAYELGYNLTIDPNYGFSSKLLQIEQIIEKWSEECQYAYKMGVADAKGDLCQS